MTDLAEADADLAAATAKMLDAVQVAAGDAVIEVAAGAGGAGIAAAARVGSSGRVVLSDIAPALVEIAAQRVAAMGHVTAQVGDQLSIDAPDASVDVVICRHGLMFAPTPQHAVREAVRVLRPGGRYAAMTWDARAANPWLGLVLDAVEHESGTEYPPAGIAGPFSLDDPRSLSEALGGGGLREVRVERLAAPMHAASLEAWWERVPHPGGQLSRALGELDDAAREAIRRRALDRAAAVARSVDGGIELAGSVLIGTGRRPV